MFFQKPSIHRYSILDAGRLTTLFRSGEVFNTVGDDFCDITKLAAFVENSLREPHIYILGDDPRHEAFAYIPMHTTSCYGGHFAIKDGYRGKKAVRDLIGSAQFMFQKTPCEAIMGFIRESNLPACLLAGYVGMKRVGKTHGTLKYHGEMVDEVIYQCNIDDFNLKYGKSFGVIEK